MAVTYKITNIRFDDSEGKFIAFYDFDLGSQVEHFSARFDVVNPQALKAWGDEKVSWFEQREQELAQIQEVIQEWQ